MSDNDDMRDGLNDDDANDCIEHIEGISGIRLTRDQLHAFLDARLIAEISEWGVEDTEVGGRIANAVSLHLLGRPWPLYGNDVNIDSYVSELHAAARNRGFELAELIDDNVPAVQSGKASLGDESHPIHHAIVVGEDRPSLLERLTPQERAALFSWSREQKPSSPGSSIDLMAWPGWADALHRVQADSTAA
jgi:hypothetical protein